MKKIVVMLILCVMVLFNQNANAQSENSNEKDVLEIKSIIKDFYSNTYNPICPEDKYDNIDNSEILDAVKVRNKIIKDNDIELYSKDYFKILYSDVEIKFIKIINQKAYASFEGITRFKCKDKEDESGMKDDYIVELNKNHNSWKISKIISSNPWDEDYFSEIATRSVKSESIDIKNVNEKNVEDYLKKFVIYTQKDKLEKIKKERKLNTKKWKDLKEEYTKKPKFTHTETRAAGKYVNKGYNRTAVRNYLTKWAYSFNPKYQRLKIFWIIPRRADCANFASQALKAGGIIDDKVGDYQWAFTSPIPNKQSNKNPRYSWYSAKGLYNYTRYNCGSNNTYGLSGIPYWLDIPNQYNNQNLQPGDLVIQFENKEPIHVMVVHSTGSNAGNVGISAHSHARLNCPLSKLGLKSNTKGEWMGMYIRGSYGYR